MYGRKAIADKLRAAATEIQKLANDNSALTTERDALLSKVASLEADTKVAPEPKAALQKEAEEGFSFRGGNAFGSTADDIPAMNSDLSSEQRLDLILNGESPSDYN